MVCEIPKHPAQEVAGYAALIHYPEHWDTAAYPTLDSAVREVLAWSGCSACQDIKQNHMLQQVLRDAHAQDVLMEWWFLLECGKEGEIDPNGRISLFDAAF